MRGKVGEGSLLLIRSEVKYDGVYTTEKEAFLRQIGYYQFLHAKFMIAVMPR